MKKMNLRFISAGLLVLVLLCFALIFHLFGGFGRVSTYLEKRQQAAEDKHLSVEEVTITVPGLSEDYTFLYIADTHVVTSGDTDTSDINTYAASRLPMFVNDEGMTSSRQFSGWIDMANEESVDALLMGGDIIDCPSDSNINFLAGQLAALCGLDIQEREKSVFAGNEFELMKTP